MALKADQRSMAREMGGGARLPKNFARAARHSRRVRFFKIGFPLLALTLIAVFAVWAWFAAPTGFTADVAGSAVTDGKLVMANPKLNGFTKANLPYEMTAERAIQDLTDTTRIVLEKIDARLPVQAENWADIVARTGIFDSEKNTLRINSPLTVRTSDGLIAKLQSAFLTMESGEIVTDDPVALEMKGSSLTAESMAVSERGKVIVFRDRVRMTILPDEMKRGKN